MLQYGNLTRGCFFVWFWHLFSIVHRSHGRFVHVNKNNKALVQAKHSCVANPEKFATHWNPGCYFFFLSNFAFIYLTVSLAGDCHFAPNAPKSFVAFNFALRAIFFYWLVEKANQTIRSICSVLNLNWNSLNFVFKMVSKGNVKIHFHWNSVNSKSFFFLAIFEYMLVFPFFFAFTNQYSSFDLVSLFGLQVLVDISIASSW